MKVLLLLSGLLVFAVGVVMAQDNPYLLPGRNLVGGGLTLDITNSDPDDGNPNTTETYREFSGSLSPMYGKMYTDRWMVGIMLTLRSQNSLQQTTQGRSNEENSRRSTGVGLTPFLRRYLPLSERFGAYFQPELSYLYNQTTDEFIRRDEAEPAANTFASFFVQQHMASLEIQVGLYYFITEHFSLEANLLNAGFTSSWNVRETTNVDNIVSSTTRDNTFNGQLTLVNQISLDRMLVLSYYF